MIEEARRQLNPEQFKAVQTIDGPLLIIAGAGSGKTRVITYRIAHMLSRGIPQSHILALTFTNKAAVEMGERIQELVGKKLRNLTVSTFHSFGVRVMKKYIETLGYREHFSIYDTSDQINLIKLSAKELGIEGDEINAMDVLQTISRLKTGRSKRSQELALYVKLYDEYQSYLKAYNALDFDDLIKLPIDLMEQNESIRQQLSDQYRYILVDEFQDTSHQQYRMLHLLARDNKNVCVVGDDDQSIYSWRGANYENIRSFERDFPGLLEIKLEQNYRSTGSILEAANKLIANNSNRKDKSLWTGGEGGKPLEHVVVEDEKHEADFICEKIRQYHLKDRVSYGDMAILIRTNSLSRILEESLLTLGIPYKMTGGQSFFQRAEIRDIIAYLRVILNPDDDISFLRIINTPRRGVGKRSLEKLGDYAKQMGLTLHKSLLHMRDLGSSLLKETSFRELDVLLDLFAEYRPKILTKRKAAEAVRALIQEIDYWGHIVSENRKNEKIAKWKYRNVELFVQLLEDFERNPETEDPNLYNYLTRISLATSEKKDAKDDKGSLQLMTVHASKGLEFDYVFLAGVEDGTIPHWRSLEEDEFDESGSLEEERRLFYVAITRAKRHLIMTSAQSRKTLKERVACTPSPFLDEIPPELLQTSEAQSTAVPDDEETTKNYLALLKQRFTGGI